jgi:hypothetical protein
MEQKKRLLYFRSYATHVSDPCSHPLHESWTRHVRCTIYHRRHNQPNMRGHVLIRGTIQFDILRLDNSVVEYSGIYLESLGSIPSLAIFLAATRHMASISLNTSYQATCPC